LLRGIGSGAEVSMISVAVLAAYLVAVLLISGKAFVNLRR
jgi:hypothetical protein